MRISHASNRRSAERSSSCRCRFACIDPDTQAPRGDLRRDRGGSDQTGGITGLCDLVDHVGLQFGSLLQAVARGSEK